MGVRGCAHAQFPVYARCVRECARVSIHVMSTRLRALVSSSRRLYALAYTHVSICACVRVR